jgi:hypothetical protein
MNHESQRKQKQKSYQRFHFQKRFLGSSFNVTSSTVGCNHILESKLIALLTTGLIN